ncbi:MAG: BglG family transcription antiterminator [Eubacteriales bacterium]
MDFINHSQGQVKEDIYRLCYNNTNYIFKGSEVMLSITQRCYGIASFLVMQEKPVTIKTIAEKFNISERTVRYDLDIVEEWFREQGVSIKRKSKVGISIEKNTPEFIHIRSSLSDPIELEQVYSTEERQALIRCLLLENSKGNTIMELAEKVNVSKSTVTKDLNALEKWLAKYNIRLVKKPNIGVRIECDEKSLRKAIVNHIYEVHNKDNLLQFLNITKINLNKKSRVSSITQNNTLGLFKNIDLDRLESCIEKIEKELNIVFTDSALVGLLVHLGLVINRIRLGKEIIMPDKQLDQLKVVPEFEVSKSVLKEIEKISGIHFPEAEIGYFTIHILGASIKKRYFKDNTGIVQNVENLVNVIKEFIIDTGHRLNRSFIDDQELLEGLLIHINPAISRIRYQIYLVNPILSDIKEQYREIFDVVKDSAVIMEKSFNVLFNDDELGYITMHIGAAVQRSIESNGNKYIKAVIVCSSGIGTAKLLSSRLKDEFDQINVINEMSLLEFEAFNKSSVDIIFTTIPIDTRQYKNVVYVSPMLTTEDKSTITNYLAELFSKDENKDRYLQKIISIIDKNCVIQNKDKLIHDLEYFLYGDRRINVKKLEKELSLKDMISEDMIRVEVDAYNWQEAITAGGMLLFNKGAVKQQYIDDMIENMIKFKSHVVISPGVALPHALHNGNVNHTCMSLITLNKPVKFGHPTNDPVKLIICLGAMDENAHIKALYELLRILEDQRLLSIIMDAKDKNEILELIHNKF